MKTRGNNGPAIQAFQTALRSDPDDQLSWLRLGEAYSKSGRHAAALKALRHAHVLDPADWICIYLIGEIQRQTGQFEEAIQSFQTILSTRPSELGVLSSLAQTHLELGHAEGSTGFTARAEKSFLLCVDVALQMIHESPGFRGLAWKTMADAIFSLSRRISFGEQEYVRKALSAVLEALPVGTSDRLTGIIELPSLEPDEPLKGFHALEIAAVAYDYRLSLDPINTSGSAWFDLGVALRFWSMKCSNCDKKAKAEKQAVKCIMESIREDPGNEKFWIALGVMHFTRHPKAAQHAFIRALDIDSKVRTVPLPLRTRTHDL
jgi:superkiller protein 3